MSDQYATDGNGSHRSCRVVLSNDQTLDLILLGDFVIKAPKDLLKECEFFENMFNSTPDQRSFKTDDCGAAVNAFLGFLRGVVPYPENAFAYVKFGLKIQYPSFIEVCVRNARTYSIPPGFSSKSAIPISTAIIRCLPTRRVQEYECVLRGVETECHCEQREYLEDISDELRKKCTNPKLPMVPLFQKKLTLAIMELTPEGGPQMAALIGEKWQPIAVDQCPTLGGIHKFHLIFGKRFIYSKSPDNAVYVKDLSSEEPAVRFCESPKIFRSHFGNLVVVTQVDNVDTLYIWSDSRMDFEKLFANSHVKIRNVSWPRDSMGRKQPLRILTEENETILIDQSGRYLAFCETGKEIKDWVKNLCLLSGAKVYRSNEDYSEVLRVAEETHVGFSNVAVSALHEGIGVYSTSVNRLPLERVHGKVHAISDVYLGIDNIAQVSSTRDS